MNTVGLGYRYRELEMSLFLYTVVPLLRGHPFRHRRVASQKGWPLKRGTFQCNFDSSAGKKWPLKRGWPLMRGASQEGDHCIHNFQSQYFRLILSNFSDLWDKIGSNFLDIPIQLSSLQVAKEILHLHYKLLKRFIKKMKVQ